MRLTVVGSSPAWPNPGGAQSGYLVEAEGRRLLLDCGPGVLARLRDRHDGWPAIDAIVITHWHLDHWGDLVPWVWGTLNGPGRNERHAELWLPPEGRERLGDFGARLGWDDMFDQTFELRDYRAGEPFQAAGFTVLARQLPHYTLLTFGLRVTNGTHSLAYSGDCGPDEALVELARDADLLVCEATLENAQLDGSAARPPLGRGGDRGIRGVGRAAPADHTPPRRAPARGRRRPSLRRPGHRARLS